MSLIESGFERKSMRKSRGEFLEEMRLMMQWAGLVRSTSPQGQALALKGGRTASVQKMLMSTASFQPLDQVMNMPLYLYKTWIFRSLVGLNVGEEISAR